MKRGTIVPNEEIRIVSNAETLRGKIRDRCNETIAHAIHYNEPIGSCYVPYDWPIYNTWSLSLYTHHLLYMLVTTIVLSYLIYLLVVYANVVIAASVGCLFILIDMTIITLLCFYPCRPTHRIYTHEYYEPSATMTLADAMPSNSECVAIMARIEEETIRETSDAICERYLVAKYRDTMVDLTTQESCVLTDVTIDL